MRRPRQGALALQDHADGSGPRDRKGLEGLIEEIVGKIKDDLTTEQEAAFYRIFSGINDRLAEYCEMLENRE